MSAGKKHVKLQGAARSRRLPEKVVAQLLPRLFPERKTPVIVAVGGPGGTGKSSFCLALARHLPDSAVLSLDNYRTPRAERSARGIYGSDPDANRMDLLAQHLELIRKGETFDRPAYDIHRGVADTTVPFSPTRFNILDGEISTYRHFRGSIDFSIFIDAHWRTQLASRIHRDVGEREASPEKAIRTFLQSNLLDASVYSNEARQWADIVLFCEDDHRIVFDAVFEPLRQGLAALAGEQLDEAALGGLVVPVLTPFCDDGSIDSDAFVRHLDFLAAHGIRRILVNGTTGEFFSLTRGERREQCSIARHNFDGAVFFHVGFSGLSETLQEAQWGQQHGADALVVAAPYYIAHASPKGLVDYFNAIAGEVSVPLLLYNFPKHSQNPLTAECLSQIPHFGIKDSSADLSLAAHTPHYYVGGDPVVAQAYEAGAFGFVSAHANQTPWLHAAMEKALIHHDNNSIDELQRKLAAVTDAFQGIGQIARIKHAVSLRLGDYPTRVRAPLVSPDAREAERLREFASTFNSDWVSQ